MCSSDLGFRPDGWRGNARTGRFVVRINGEWVDAEVVRGPLYDPRNERVRA